MTLRGLEETVARYNHGQETGNDVLGRKHMPLKIAKAPFYAIKLHSWSLSSSAGLAVDKELRVIRDDGTPIPGLYAAGELLGSGATMGSRYCRRNDGDTRPSLLADCSANQCCGSGLEVTNLSESQDGECPAYGYRVLNVIRS